MSNVIDWEEYELTRGDEPPAYPQIHVIDGGTQWCVYEGKDPFPLLQVDKDQCPTKHDAWLKGHDYITYTLESSCNGLKDEDAACEVNAPKHYTVGGQEAIDVIRAKLTDEEYRGYCKGNVLKYLMRANYKGHHDLDCAKAEWYMEELNNALEIRKEDSPEA